MDMEEVKVEEEVKNVIISVTTSDAVKPKGTVRRNSTGKANTRTSPSLLNSDEKLLPHYLRASTSSCHEFCKYGRKHDFAPKERKPRFLRSSEIPDEKQKTEVSTIRVRRKRPELKEETTSQPKDGLLDKPRGGIKKNALKEIQLPGTHAVEENESFEASESKKLQTPSPSQGHIACFEPSPFSEGEESFEGPESIKTDIQSPAHQVDKLSDSSEISHLESSSPTEKRVISHEPATSLAWSDRLSDGSESMELEMPSPIHTPNDQVEGSSEEPLSVEIMIASPGTESTSRPDETIISKPMIPPLQKSLKAKISAPTQERIAAKARPTREEKSSEKALGLGLKLKGPSPNRRNVAATEERNLTNKLKAVEGKNREETKVKPSPQWKTVSHRAKVIRQVTVTKKRTSAPVEETTGTSSKPEIAEQKSPSSVKRVIVSVSPRATKQKNTEQRRSLSSVTKAAGSVSLRATKQEITEQNSRQSVKKVLVSVSPQVTKQKASATIKVMDTPARPSVSLKPKSPVVKSTPTLMDTPARPSVSLKPKSPVVKSTPTLVSLRRLSSPKQTGNKMVGSADLSKPRETPVLKSLRSSMSTKPSVGGETTSLKSRNLKSSAPAKIQRTVGKEEDTNEKLKEKTLYAIEPKTMKTDPKPTKKKLKQNRADSSSNTSSSSSSSMSSASSVSSHEKEENEESTVSEASEVILEKERIGKSTSRPATVHSEVKPFSPHKLKFQRGKVVRLSRPAIVHSEVKPFSPHKLKFQIGKVMRPSRPATVHSEVKPSSPHKLKFQRGKVVSPKPENNAPWKLRFRQAKGSSENLIEAGRRSFRRRRVSFGSSAELVKPRLEAQAVVLRHQDVQQKKDPQGLLNLVIEETASKLVETKKSKVKALVSAFETVISLQESRVSPTV